MVQLNTSAASKFVRLYKYCLRNKMKLNYVLLACQMLTDES